MQSPFWNESQPKVIGWQIVYHLICCRIFSNPTSCNHLKALQTSNVSVVAIRPNKPMLGQVSNATRYTGWQKSDDLKPDTRTDGLPPLELACWFLKSSSIWPIYWWIFRHTEIMAKFLIVENVCLYVNCSIFQETTSPECVRWKRHQCATDIQGGKVHVGLRFRCFFQLLSYPTS